MRSFFCKIDSNVGVKIISASPAKTKEPAGFFAATAGFYCRATDYFIGIMRKPCNGSFSDIIRLTCVVRETELLCRPTVKPLLAKYDFEKSV